MKNQKTMYLLAKAKAIADGPKTYRMFSGYALTRAELKRLYFLEGFANERTIQRHLDSWEEYGLVERHPIGPSKDEVYFFVLDLADSKERGYHETLKQRFPSAEETNPGVMCA